MTRNDLDTSDMTPDNKFWLRAVPRAITLVGTIVGGLALIASGSCIAENTVRAYKYIRIAEVKADMVQSIVDGAVTIVQTIVAGAI
jgi:hypothetical protein